MPRCGPRLGFAVLAGTLGFPAGAAAYPGLAIVYAPSEGARAIHDGEPGLAGLTDSLRQGPIFDDPRWAASRQLAKVSGRALSQMDLAGMVATLRAGIVDPCNAVAWRSRSSSPPAGGQRRS